MSIKTKLAKGAVALAVVGASLLGSAATASANPNAAWLGYGYTTSGKGVWCVQQDLNKVIDKGVWRGWASTPPPYGNIAEDGAWGRQTAATVKWFQSWLGSGADGIVGPETGSLLLSNSEGNSYCWGLIPGDYL
ncbi:peptidoglycan-binding domain-containing protein [Streptomyces lavendulae]|uniref:peptidoglycan-binding domain-containing protein n=1 Tax=Streptomyces lavendulae TaxID=1914 RepID=UPI0024A21482|nr:hypothetical protein Sros01_45240 [Streptomyces roseochromogenus]